MFFSAVSRLVMQLSRMLMRKYRKVATGFLSRYIENAATRTMAMTSTTTLEIRDEFQKRNVRDIRPRKAETGLSARGVENRSPGLVQIEPGRCVDAVSLGRRETFRVRAGSVALYNRE